MGNGLRLVVVAHPRSGSNTLVESLDCHPDLTLLNEPFNENFSTWLPANPDYRAGSPTSPPSTRWSMASSPLTPGSSCITYQLDMELLAHLLLTPRTST